MMVVLVVRWRYPGTVVRNGVSGGHDEAARTGGLLAARRTTKEDYREAEPSSDWIAEPDAAPTNNAKASKRVVERKSQRTLGGNSWKGSRPLRQQSQTADLNLMVKPQESFYPLRKNVHLDSLYSTIDSIDYLKRT